MLRQIYLIQSCLYSDVSYCNAMKNTKHENI